MTVLVEYKGHLWEVVSMEGGEVTLKSPHNQVATDSHPLTKVVNKKELELDILTDDPQKEEK